jgi:hypothetical protein
MAKYEFEVTKVCEGGCHLIVQVIKDGLKDEVIVIDADSETTWSDGLTHIIRQSIMNTPEKEKRIAKIKELSITL